MDKLINEICAKLGLTLDFELLTSEFEKNPDGAADNHVIETLFTILDFHKFKELMLAYQNLDETSTQDSTNPSQSVTNDEISSQLELMVEDGRTLLNSGDLEIWKLHTKIEEKGR